jgi:hypothetical protein
MSSRSDNSSPKWKNKRLRRSRTASCTIYQILPITGPLVKRQVTTKGSGPCVIEDYTIAFLDGYLIAGKERIT